MEANKRRTALVTGASSGIGKAIAEAFARDGHDVVVVGRDTQALAGLAEDFKRRYGVGVVPLVCDLSISGNAQALYTMVRDAKVYIDFLVNNAGAGVFGSFKNTSVEQELAMLELNIVAPTVLCKQFLPQLIRQRGRIMNVASLAAFMPGPQMAAYYASKSYLLSFSEALAEELTDTGVSVTTFCPGPTATGFQERAAMSESRLIKGKRLACPKEVGLAGYRAMLAGRRVYVPGVMNKLMAQSIRLLPRRALTRAVNRMSQPA